MEWRWLPNHLKEWDSSALSARSNHHTSGCPPGKHLTYGLMQHTPPQSLSGEPHHLIPTKSGRQSFGGASQPWAWELEQSFPGLGRSLVGGRGGVSQDRQIKVTCHVFSSLTCAAYSKEREDANLPEDWSQHIPGFAEVLSLLEHLANESLHNALCEGKFTDQFKHKEQKVAWTIKCKSEALFVGHSRI